MKSIIFLILAISALVIGIAYSQVVHNSPSGVSVYADDQYVNTYDESQIFELDASGDVMPSVSGQLDVHFEEDASGNIQPKDQDCFTQDASGDYQPVE